MATTGGTPLVVEKYCSATAETQVALLVIAGIILSTNLNTTLEIRTLCPGCKILKIALLKATRAKALSIKSFNFQKTIIMIHLKTENPE